MAFISELNWRPTIGDPSFMGWFTVVAYAVAAALAALAGWGNTGSDTQLRKQRDWLWLIVALVMAGLCINKQLDLQSLFTDIGRVIARHQGWYEQRRDFQKWFVVGMIGAAGAFAFWFILRFREFWMNHKLLAGGALFLMTFLLVRAISFHHFDVVIGSTLFGVRMNWIFELTGIFLISLAAVKEGAAKSQR
jgi:hypothetical protein